MATIRIVIVGCNKTGLLLGKLFSRGKDNEVQYIDRARRKEPRPKLKIGSKWCKFSSGEIYFFTDKRHEYYFVPLIDKEPLKFKVEEIANIK